MKCQVRLQPSQNWPFLCEPPFDVHRTLDICLPLTKISMLALKTWWKIVPGKINIKGKSWKYRRTLLSLLNWKIFSACCCCCLLFSSGSTDVRMIIIINYWTVNRRKYNMKCLLCRLFFFKSSERGKGKTFRLWNFSFFMVEKS